MSTVFAEPWLRTWDALCREQLASFVVETMRVLSPGDHLQWNYHIAAISYALEQVASGRCKRLLITCPPRHLKSIISSVAFPAWVFGRDPRAKIVCVSHTAELSIKHHNDCRRLMASPAYRRLFAGTLIARDKNTETEFRTLLGGERYSTSVGGPITGRGGRIIIVDDPMKAEDAYSELKRETVQDWYRRTLLSRRDDPKSSAIVVVMQRLHDDDLAGFLIEEGGWTHLNLPAIAEEDERVQVGPETFYRRPVGEVLHPERISREELDALRIAMGDTDFSAQYQQRPAPLEGAIIKRAWLKRYPIAPERRPGDEIVQSWDMAVKTGEKHDYSVCATFLRRGQTHYLLHVLRERMEFPALLRCLLAHRRAFGPGPLLVEDAAAGAQVLQALRADPHLPNAIACKPEGDKASRLHGQSRKFESGDVLLPESAAWLAELEAELLAFPKGRHDDQVDSISQYLRWCDKRAAPTITSGGECLILGGD